MNEQPSKRLIHEAVGVFDDAVSLEAAIDDLESSGFDRAEISLLAGENAVVEKLGHHYARVTELEDDPEVPRSAFVSTQSIGDAKGALVGGLVYVGAVAAAGAMVASGGSALAAVIAASALGGAGGLIGTTLGQMVERHHADYLREQIDRGGLLLWVHARDDAHQQRAKAILSRHSAHDVHIHAV